MSSLRKTFSVIAATLAALVLAACETTYTEKNLTNEPPPILKSTSRIYVAIPFDASFKDTVAQQSGKNTAEAFQVAFLRYSRSVYTSKFPESAGEALESARRANMEYVLYPTILRWEDRATEYTGLRDRLALKVDLIDLNSGTIVFSREAEVTGKWMSDGGETPRDLLTDPAEQFANSVFRRIDRPSAL
jgi:PBP1b-binding outer membrane lipoprotein LpoB